MRVPSATRPTTKPREGQYEAIATVNYQLRTRLTYCKLQTTRPGLSRIGRCLRALATCDHPASNRGHVLRTTRLFPLLNYTGLRTLSHGSCSPCACIVTLQPLRAPPRCERGWGVPSVMPHMDIYLLLLPNSGTSCRSARSQQCPLSLAPGPTSRSSWYDSIRPMRCMINCSSGPHRSRLRDQRETRLCLELATSRISSMTRE